MTDREKIINEHTQLAKEFSMLSNSDALMNRKEWEQVNSRMNQILSRIDDLKKIESTWGEDIETLKPRMYSIENISDECNCSRQQVAMWLEIGIIKAIKTGKGYMIPREEYERFLRDYLGYDISNREKALRAYEVVNCG